MSSVLDEERREAFLQALQSLQEDQQEADKWEQEEKQRQEDQLRRDIEEARKLRAENEERERRRSEEERARQEGSEVDYGIDRTPSAAGSSKPRRSPKQSSMSRPPQSSAAKRGKAVTPPSFGTRAVTALSNIRGLIEQMSASLRSNPVFLIRTLAFILGVLLMFGRKSIREKISRVLGTGWDKIKATAGMGVKVSYI